MTLIKSIPKKQREIMIGDTFYHKCCLQDKECFGKIQWHHHFKWSGKRTNDIFGILPVCEFHHRNESRKDIKERLDWIMVNRMTEIDFRKYRTRNWEHTKKYLNKKYGEYKIKGKLL